MKFSLKIGLLSLFFWQGYSEMKMKIKEIGEENKEKKKKRRKKRKEKKFFPLIKKKS